MSADPVSTTMAREAPDSSDAVKDRIRAAVDAARPQLRELSHRIHAHPEPAFEERQASACRD